MELSSNFFTSSSAALHHLPSSYISIKDDFVEGISSPTIVSKVPTVFNQQNIPTSLFNISIPNVIRTGTDRSATEKAQTPACFNLGNDTNDPPASGSVSHQGISSTNPSSAYGTVNIARSPRHVGLYRGLKGRCCGRGCFRRNPQQDWATRSCHTTESSTFIIDHPRNNNENRDREGDISASVQLE